MKRFFLIAGVLTAVFLTGCMERENDSDSKQQAQQEKLLDEGTSQVGMPAIKNFRERKILKDILELRDQNGLVTYTYLENMTPTVVHGHTVLGGKLTFFCNSVGYAISAATQFTSPQKLTRVYAHDSAYVPMPQADPNGLFPPSSAEGSWVLCKDPNGPDTMPTYSEPRLVTTPFKLPLD